MWIIDNELKDTKLEHVNARLVEITPALAQTWLKRNIDNNRSIRPSIVWKYAKDMKDGNWGLNPDAITFDREGKLINGQHRLSAIVKANTTVKMFVLFDSDITQDELLNVDRGSIRSVADNMEIAGYSNDVFVCSISTARAFIECKLGNRCPSQQTLLKHIKAHYNDYATILPITKMRRFGSTGIKAMVAAGILSAYMAGERFDALEKFAVVYRTFDVQGCDAYNPKYAQKLKEYLNKSRPRNKKELAVVESHIHAFAHNSPKVAFSYDYYPLIKTETDKQIV